jgi:hypothetical protein
MKKFEVCNHTDYVKINSWYHKCVAEKIPYVLVKKRTKYATVEFDYITLPKSAEPLLRYDESTGHNREHIDTLIKRIILMR